MEPLLGTASGLDARTRQYSERAQRDATMERETHPSTMVEREEEHRFEAGVGEGGAFAERSKHDSSREGIERPVWEYRNEDEVVRAKAGPTAADADTPEELADEIAHDPFPTPFTVNKAAQLAHGKEERSAAVRVVDGFRFVDVSSDKPFYQNYFVHKRAQKRAKGKGKI